MLRIKEEGGIKEGRWRNIGIRGVKGATMEKKREWIKVGANLWEKCDSWN